MTIGKCFWGVTALLEALILWLTSQQPTTADIACLVKGEHVPGCSQCVTFTDDGQQKGAGDKTKRYAHFNYLRPLFSSCFSLEFCTYNNNWHCDTCAMWYVCVWDVMGNEGCRAHPSQRQAYWNKKKVHHRNLLSHFNFTFYWKTLLSVAWGSGRTRCTCRLLVLKGRWLKLRRRLNSVAQTCSSSSSTYDMTACKESLSRTVGRESSRSNLLLVTRWKSTLEERSVETFTSTMRHIKCLVFMLAHFTFISYNPPTLQLDECDLRFSVAACFFTPVNTLLHIQTP